MIPTTPIPRPLLPTLLAAALCATACDPAPAPGPSAGDTTNVTVRDSAGIRIIENHAPQRLPDQFWSIAPEPEIVIGGREGEAPDSSHLVWRVADLALLPDGRVAALSAGHGKVFLFEPSGKFSKSIGRRGQGPGEFLQPSSLQYLPGDTLVVWDGGNRPVSYFDTAGALLRHRRIDVGKLISAIGTGKATEGSSPLPDGSFVVTVIARDVEPPKAPPGEWWRPPFEYIRIDSGYAAHSFGSWGGIEQANVDMGGRRMWMPGLFWVNSSMAGGGTPPSVYASAGDRYEIRQFSPEGVLRRIIRRTTDPVPITDEGRKAALERHCGPGGWGRLFPSPEACRREMESISTRSSYPPISHLMVDEEGYLWVGSWRGWSVFDPEGRWLGALAVPQVTVRWIGRDLLLGVARNEDGVERIEGYRLTRGER